MNIGEANAVNTGPSTCPGRCPVTAQTAADLVDARSRGLYRKYRVERRNDPTGKHDLCRYFVLDPQHDPHAVAALRAYADSARGDYPQLAADLDDWALRAAAARAEGGETE